MTQDPQINPSTDNGSNLDLLYDYTNSLLEKLTSDTNNLNTKLGILIGFSATLIRIAVDLPGRDATSHLPCNTCLLLQSFTLGLLIGSILLSASGLLTSAQTATFVKPSELLENWYYAEPEVCKLFILKGLSKAISGLDEERARKAQRLTWSILLLTTAVTLLAIGFLLPNLIA
ncbi:MAG: hypothetical protein AAFY11_03515 [Cyanobacteria bacterium J06641_5]